MAKKTAGKVGFKQTNKAALGPYQIHLVRAVHSLGKVAYGAELERHLIGLGVDTDRGQVYQACRRMEERGFLSSEEVPEPKRPTYRVTVYRVTKAGDAALAASLAIYDAHRLMATSIKKSERDK